MDRDIDQLLREAKAFVLREYGSKGYSFWLKLNDEGPLFILHPDEPKIEIEISCFNDPFNSESVIRVLVSLFEVHPKVNLTRVPTGSFLVFSDGRIDRLTGEDEGTGKEGKEGEKDI